MVSPIHGQNWETVQRYPASERVEWVFITKRAPWCGGYWERLVRSVKTALKATSSGERSSIDLRATRDRGARHRGQEEKALTLAHFLIGQSLTAFPDRSNRASQGTLSSSLRHLLRRWS
ncbi:hypothetical protein T4B_3970 [Trichinella pseudospiralis]|uniref:Uncharacterized protein n=1 Tax=Trichinella pseudospiralis TaxID=6337 RepID=A0A0V1DTH4_TRIPS|nr:hypothetical protein T4A_5063 [Trichinella pseudospiralis]KRY99715.1 hypothetical protein T4B_3970 [Trichinella pseudospiralis]